MDKALVLKQKNPAAKQNISEGIQESSNLFPHELNISDGAEFIDDNIRMKDQPLGKKEPEEDDYSFESMFDFNNFSVNLKTNVMNPVKQFFPTTTLSAAEVSSMSENSISQIKLKGVKDIVLVHGAFADGSSWSKVIPILQAKGLNVIAVQNPLTSFADDVTATKRAIAQLDGPVLLVGHSYGGMVISEAGKDPKVAGLVYIAALVPEDGQNVIDVNAAMPTTGVEKEFQLSPDGHLTLPRKGINEHFAQDVSPEERGIIFATQGSWAASSTQEKVYNPAWETKPSWYVVAADDGMINPDLERFKAKLMKATTIELKSSHVPMVSQPEKVADFIIKAAANL